MRYDKSKYILTTSKPWGCCIWNHSVY